MVNLDRLFYPNNLCLIGVSDIPIKGSTAHYYALKRVGFDKPVYCVNRNRDKVIFGTKAYKSILEIPENEIDYVIIGVPREYVPGVLRDCIKKRVKFATIFTSGFSELGTEDGRALEDELRKIVAEGGPRIIGPNCLGPFCRESRITTTEIMDIHETPLKAATAFISQSGGHSGSFFEIGENRGFPFNKLVSIGNQCDLKIQDFIEYFGKDKDIKVISCYIEEVKRANEFLKILRRVAQIKPVIFWRGGQTEGGIKAAASHTGAVGSSYEIFKSAIEQNGGIIVESIEELADLTMGSLYLAEKRLGDRIGIIVPGGGSCVEMTDQILRNGLKVPELQKRTRDNIQQFIQKVNTSTRNPVDLGVYGWLPRVCSDAMIEVAKDPNIDVIVFYMMIERLPRFIERMQDEGLGRSFVRNIKRACKSTTKPLIVIIPNFNVNNVKITHYRKEFIDRLCKIGVPHFESMERASRTLLKLLKYIDWKRKIIELDEKVN
ncbi:MAG: CoA-binding protein [Candidatus Helarchaeota archaeon]